MGRLTSRYSGFIHRRFIIHLLNMGAIWLSGCYDSPLFRLYRTILKKIFKKTIGGFKTNFLHLRQFPINTSNKIGIMNLRLRNL